MSEEKRAEVTTLVSHMHNSDLFIHLISALRNESYRYAGILSDEIKRRPFSQYEVNTIRNSEFYGLLNGVLD